MGWPPGTTVHACAMTLAYGDTPNPGCSPRHQHEGRVACCSSAAGGGGPCCHPCGPVSGENCPERVRGLPLAEDMRVGGCCCYFPPMCRKLQASRTSWLVAPPSIFRASDPAPVSTSSLTLFFGLRLLLFRAFVVVLDPHGWSKLISYFGNLHSICNLNSPLVPGVRRTWTSSGT